MPRKAEKPEELVGYSLDLPRGYLDLADKIATGSTVPLKRAQVLREALRRGLELLDRSSKARAA